MPPPANAHEPRPRVGNRRTGSRLERGPDEGAFGKPLPSVEVHPRGEAVENTEWHSVGRARPPFVPSRVQEHVSQRVAGLAGRSELASVIAVGEDATSTPRSAIDRAGEPDGQPLHPARERAPVRGLDDEVQVVSLNRIVEQAKPEPIFAPDERTTNLTEASLRREGRDVAADAQRDVNRVMPRLLRTREM